jgi:hypothetical protein
LIHTDRNTNHFDYLATFSFAVFTIYFVSSKVIQAQSSLSLGYISIIALFVLIFSLIRNRGTAHPLLGLIVLFLLSFTSTISKPFALLDFNQTQAELFLLCITGYLTWRAKNYVWALLLLFFIITYLLSFQEASLGRVLNSDDHPTFLFRLEMLKEHFPYIPFYNPLWNAGTDERFFFATGAINIYIILLPIIYLFDLWHNYNFVPLFILFGLLPLSVFFAVRLLNYTYNASFLASLLAITSSLSWYKWAIAFGPLGFLTTTALSPLLFSLSIRLLDKDRGINIYESCFLILITTLVLLWSPGGLIFVPIILTALLKIKSLIKKKHFKFIVLSILLINIPWILVFWSASNVSSFLDKSRDVKKLHSEAPTAIYQEKTPTVINNGQSALVKKIDQTIGLIQRYFYSANLILILLSLPAILFLAPKHRLHFIIFTLWLFLLAGFLSALKPQLELDRLFVVLFIILSMPVGIYLESIFRNYENLTTRISYAIFFGFIFLYLLSVGSIFKSRTVIPLNFRSSLVENIINAINKNDNGGRVLFAGFILHEMDSGHIAPFSLKSKVPLYASSPVHQYWRYRDVIPHEFLARREQGITDFLDITNTGLVITHERTWYKFFKSKANDYEIVFTEKNFNIFKRKNFTPSYFISGQGTITEQTSSYIKLKLETENARIKFNYFPFLQSSACQITKYEASPNLHFIELSNCPINKEIIIKSKPAYARIKF